MGEVSKKKRWRIVSDGTALGTKIISPKGEALPWVQKVTWSLSVENPVAVAEFVVALPSVDVCLRGRPIIVQEDSKPSKKAVKKRTVKK